MIITHHLSFARRPSAQWLYQRLRLCDKAWRRRESRGNWRRHESKRVHGRAPSEIPTDNGDVRSDGVRFHTWHDVAKARRLSRMRLPPAGGDGGRGRTARQPPVIASSIAKITARVRSSRANASRLKPSRPSNGMHVGARNREQLRTSTSKTEKQN